MIIHHRIVAIVEIMDLINAYFLSFTVKPMSDNNFSLYIKSNISILPRYDELSIAYGEVINIHDKQEDDWWLGECGGKVGIFPATYVEQI